MITKEKEISVKKDLVKYKALLTKDEGKLLFCLPENIPADGVILEIGALRGGSTILLAKGSRLAKKNRVYSIDPHVSGTLKEFKKNIKNAGVENLIVPIFKTSEEAAKNWKKPISLLWIDGDHRYELVKKDFLLWEKYLVKGGIIVFHDSNETNKKTFFNKENHLSFEGPKRVVKECILNSKRFKDIKVIDTITYARKIKNAGILDFVKNKYYSFYANIKNGAARIIGLFGIFLKKYLPRLYYKLKSFAK